MPDGPPIATTRSGANGSRLVLIHGFTQTSGSWGPFGAALADRHAVVAVDAPGHGRSADLAAGLAEGADLIAETAGTGTYIGYSMGARWALHVALRRPETVERLVLISASAGIEDPAERAARRESDEELAQRIESEGVEPFVNWWLSRPMWATLPAEAARAESRLANTAPGLASSLRLAGAAATPPLWERLDELQMPVLVVAGGLDAAYRARAERLHRLLPHSRLAIVAGAGHACHLEQPEAVAGAVLDWLSQRQPRR